jgi:hypothetical protein
MHKYYNADTCHNKPAKLTRPEQHYAVVLLNHSERDNLYLHQIHMIKIQ